MDSGCLAPFVPRPIPSRREAALDQAERLQPAEETLPKMSKSIRLVIALRSELRVASPMSCSRHGFPVFSSLSPCTLCSLRGPAGSRFMASNAAWPRRDPVEQAVRYLPKTKKPLQNRQLKSSQKAGLIVPVFQARSIPLLFASQWLQHERVQLLSGVQVALKHLISRVVESIRPKVTRGCASKASG